MSNFMKNARSWLGLGQDPYYDEYGDPPLDGEWDDDDVDEDLVDVQPAAAAGAHQGSGGPADLRVL